jgi:N-acetylglucosaminyldiphosphoundecaprenol N-acetyl-beta-D-mannosaminyltransferase
MGYYYRMRVNLLGADIDALSMEETVERAAGLIRDYRSYWIMTLNPELLYQAQSEKELLDLARRADIVTADGEGIVWACRMAGHPVPERVTGIDLLLHLVERAAAENWSVYLLGAAPGVAGEAADRLGREYPGLRIAGAHHGYFQADEESRIAEDIKKAKPDLLFVALGAPKQEIWIDRHFGKFGSGVAVGVGGSFDVLAGRVRRAPRWVRQLHLEWLSRLLRDPSRWRRQLVLPLFAWTVIKHYKLKK